MQTDTEIKIQGFTVLVEAMGDVLAEKFISLVLREPFDYTKWRQQLFPDIELKKLSQRAMEYRATLAHEK